MKIKVKQDEQSLNPINEMPYSYHTFLFPFRWKKTGDSTNVKKFERLLRKDKTVCWEEYDAYEGKIPDAEYYAQVQYFKKDAANIFFDLKDTNVVKTYRLTVNNIHNFSKGNIGYYSITKGKNDTEKTEYRLRINGIHLSVYEIGVAVLSFELEYWGDKYVTSADGKTVHKISKHIVDVNAINEYGRRINLPYVGDKIHHFLVADKIEIKIGDFYEEENYSKTIDDFINKNIPLSPHFIMKPIKNLICNKGVLTTNIEKTKPLRNRMFVEPIIDDRMYVCCLLMDNQLSKSLKNKNESGEYEIFNNETIYKLAFIENSLSCPSDKMMPDILKRCIYDRWINWGTIDIITHHSFVRITSDEAIDAVVYPFLTEYVKMAQLAVVQRATLIALENECVFTDTKKISKLQEKYVKAQKEILLDECTVQEQGIEEFNMLRRELFVKERTDSLDKRLKDLYELANLQHDSRQNRWMAALTVAGIFLAIPGVVIPLYEIHDHSIDNILHQILTLLTELLGQI